MCKYTLVYDLYTLINHSPSCKQQQSFSLCELFDPINSNVLFVCNIKQNGWVA